MEVPKMEDSYLEVQKWLRLLGISRHCQVILVQNLGGNTLVWYPDTSGQCLVVRQSRPGDCYRSSFLP
jgi:hypothetical protein